MAPSQRLAIGDRVSVLGVDAFNPDYLKEHHPQSWHRIRFEAKVLGLNNNNGKWVLEFDDGERWQGARKQMVFVSRPAREEEEEEEEDEEEEERPPPKRKERRTVSKR